MEDLLLVPNPVSYLKEDNFFEFIKPFEVHNLPLSTRSTNPMRLFHES